MGVLCNARWRCGHCVFQVSHDQIDPAGQCFGLPGFQVMRQLVDIGVAHRRGKMRAPGQAADTHHAGVREISEGFQMVGAFGGIFRAIGLCFVYQPVTDGIHTGLIVGHGVGQGGRCAVLTKNRGLERRQAGHVSVVCTGQPFQRVGAKMNGPFGVRE